MAKDVKEVKEHIEGLSSQMRAVSLSFNFLFTCSCVYLGPVPERCNSLIPGINVPHLVIYPWDKAHLSLELICYTFQEPAHGL